MRLGFSLSAVPLGVLIADLVCQVTTEEPYEWCGRNNRQDDEAQLGEFELETENDGGSVLCRGRERADEDGVEGDDPEDVGEEGGLDCLDDGAPAEIPLERNGEEAEVILVGAVSVPGVVETGAGLAGSEWKDRSSSCVSVLDLLQEQRQNGSHTKFVLRTLPSSLRNKEDHSDPHNDTSSSGDIV